VEVKMSETDLLAGNDKRYYCIDFYFYKSD